MGSGGRREIGIEIKGKEYTVREFDLDVYGDAENFVKAKYARLFRESAGKMSPKKVNEEVMKILRTSYTADELAEEMSATDCVVFVAYLAMRHNPGMTFEIFCKTVEMSDVATIGDIIDGMGDDDEVNPPEKEAESP